jgi:hypothetical protein
MTSMIDGEYDEPEDEPREGTWEEGEGGGRHMQARQSTPRGTPLKVGAKRASRDPTTSGTFLAALQATEADATPPSAAPVMRTLHQAAPPAAVGGSASIHQAGHRQGQQQPWMEPACIAWVSQ